MSKQHTVTTPKAMLAGAPIKKANDNNVFDRLTNNKQLGRKPSGVGFGKRQVKKEPAPALGLRRAGNQIKTQSNTLGTSTSGTSLGFHAGKVNQTIYSSKEGDESNSQIQNEESKMGNSYNAGYDVQPSWSVQVIDQAHSNPI